MKKIQHRIEYILLVFLGGFFRLLPLNFSFNLGVLLGRLACLINKKHRKIALTNLKESFPEKSDREHKEILARFYKNLGILLMEFLHVKKIIKRMKLEIEGREYLDAALKKNKGIIALTGHFGNWELLGAIIVNLGYKLTVVYFEQRNKLTDKYINNVRNSMGIELIPKNKSAKLSLMALKQNYLLGLISDQDAGNNGVFVNFLGRPASTPRGPVLFSMKTGAPMLLLTLLRKGFCDYKFSISPPVELELTGNSEEEIRINTQKWSDLFEKKVRERPEQWFWVHRRWATKKAGN